MSEIILNFQPGRQPTTVRVTERPSFEVKEVAAPANSRTIVTGPRGEKGEEGDPGTPGASAVFEFRQTTAALTWIVNHNFGFRPNVAVLSPGGREMLAEVQHTSP